MRALLIVVVLLGLSLTLVACATDVAGEGPTDTPAEGTGAVKTPEIVRILEEEHVVFTGTTHSQRIHIRLMDGREFKGVYVRAQAGKYSRADNLGDILNLVMHIKKNRPADEVKDWQILCE